MTQAQATTQAATQTAALPPASNLIFDILPTYPPNIWENTNAWVVIMFPSAYSAQYTAATLEQKIAFARVAVKTLQTSPATGEDFKNEFDTIGAADSVLQPYLYP
jgi:hypothetical protein